jgi:4-hydroxy-tetrahydrodipicolinate synthase
VAHFTAVADASPVPIVLYNIPYRTGEALEPDGVLALAEHPNIVGIKQSVPLDAAALRVLAESPPDFAVLCGEDPFMFPTALLGAAGAIAASAHVCTKRIVAMVDAGREGRVEDGRRHHTALLSVLRACFAEPSPTVFKGILHREGLIESPGVRLPLVPASPAAVDAAVAAVAAAVDAGV